MNPFEANSSTLKQGLLIDETSVKRTRPLTEKSLCI